MKINLKYLWRSFAAGAIALSAFGVAPAIAGVYGSANLDITNGQFSYNSGGASFTPLTSTTPTSYIELATGNFAFINTLPPSNQNFNYSGYANVDVNGGQNGGGQTFSRSINFGYTSLATIMTTPNGQAALALFTMFAGSPTGSATAQGYNFSWAYIIDTPMSNGGSGRFNLWSNTDYTGSANPAGLMFPATASFSAKMAFNAVPEPGILGILALGLLMIGIGARRKNA